MPQFIWIATAGALGALCRWGISRGVHALFGMGFAWGTLIVNVLGCFLLGFLMYTGLNTAKIPETVRITLAIGFLGALTTFSTFSYETVRYLEDGTWLLAFANIGTNLVVGLGATIAGLALGRTFLGGTS
ncbi:MAG: CrcB family protein [Planctomycetota bacterium]